MTTPLAHFLDLVHRGAYPTAGSGAVAAAELAQVILLQVPALDSQALKGLHEFVTLAKYQPETAAEVAASDYTFTQGAAT